MADRRPILGNTSYLGPVQFDVAGSPALVTKEFTHTVAGGPNRVMLIGIIWEDGGVTWDPPTVNGNASTYVPSSEIGANTINYAKWYWYEDPPEGDVTVAVTITQNAPAAILVAMDFSKWDGVDPVGGITATSGATASISLSSIAVDTNTTVVTAVTTNIDTSSYTSWTNATEVVDRAGLSLSGAVSYREVTSGSTVSITATYGATPTRQAITAIKIKGLEFNNVAGILDGLTLAEYPANIDQGIPAGVDGLTLAEIASNVDAATNVNAGVDGLTLAEITAGIGQGIPAGIDGLTLAEIASNVDAATNVNAGVDGLTLAEIASNVNAATNVNAGIDGLTLAEIASNVNAATNINAAVDGLTLAEIASNVNAATNVNAGIDGLTLTEYTANIDQGIATGIDGLTLAEIASNVNAATNVNAAVDGLTLAEYAANIGQGIAASVDALTLAEITSNVNAATAVNAGVDSLTLDEYTFNMGTVVQCGIDGLTLAEYSANIDQGIATGVDGLTLSEQLSNIDQGIPVSIDGLTLAEIASNVNAATNVNAGVDGLTLAEIASNVNAATDVNAGVDGLTLAEQLSNIDQGIATVIDGLTLAELASNVNAATNVNAGVDGLTLAEITAGINQGIPAGIDGLTLAELTSNIDQGIPGIVDGLSLVEYTSSISSNFTSSTDALTLVGLTSTISQGVNVFVGTYGLVVDRHNAYIDLNLYMNYDDLSLVELTSNVNAQIVLASAIDTITLAEYPATIVFGIATGLDSLTLAEYVASFSYNLSVSTDALSLQEYISTVKHEGLKLYSNIYADAPASRNLLKWSNGFGNAAITKVRSTITYSSATTRWDGDAGVWLLTEDSTATSTHFYRGDQGGSVLAGTAIVYSVCAKTNGRGMYIDFGTDNSVFSSAAGGHFDLSNGTVLSSYGGATGAIESLGSGWYRISATATPSGSGVLAIRVYLSNGSTNSYTGGGSLGAYIAEQQFEVGAEPTPYIHTETVPLRSDQIIVRAITPHNLIGYSNDLSNAYWTKTRSSISGSITLNAGASNGWGGAVLSKIVEDTTASNSHVVQNSTDVMSGDPSGLVTCRFLFASTNRGVRLLFHGDSSSNNYYYGFSQAGVLNTSGVTGTGALHSYTVTEVDSLTVDGTPNTKVYEVIIRGWPSTTSDTTIYQAIFNVLSGTSTSYTGDGTSGIYLGKIQVVNGYDLPDYSETTTATSPFAATISAATLNGVAQGVALDAIILQTEDQTQTTPWSRTNIHAVTAEGVSADGYPAYKVDCNTTAGQHNFVATSQKTHADSALLTVFCDFKSDERTWARLSVRDKSNAFPGTYVNLSTGVLGTAITGGAGAATALEAESRGSGWYRVRVVASVYTGGTTPAVRINVAEADNDQDFAGLGANDGLLVSRCFAVEGNVAMADADAAYVRAGSTMEYVRDRSSAIVTMPAFSKYVAGQSHQSTKFNYDIPIAIYDGSHNISKLVQVSPYQPTNYGLVGSGPYKFSLPSIGSGDSVYIKKVTGTTGTAYPNTIDYQSSGMVELDIRGWDEGTSSWVDSLYVYSLTPNLDSLTITEITTQFGIGITTSLDSLSLQTTDYIYSFNINIPGVLDSLNLQEYASGFAVGIIAGVDALVLGNYDYTISYNIGIDAVPADLLLFKYTVGLPTYIPTNVEQFTLLEYGSAIVDGSASIGIPTTLSYKFTVRDGKDLILSTTLQRVESVNIKYSIQHIEV